MNMMMMMMILIHRLRAWPSSVYSYAPTTSELHQRWVKAYLMVIFFTFYHGQNEWCTFTSEINDNYSNFVLLLLSSFYINPVMNVS